MKKLSFNMLKGLFADIINSTVKANLYCFNKYKILVVDKCEEKDIKKLERLFMFENNGNLSIQEKNNKRLREIYYKRKKNNRCVKCGVRELETLKNGGQGIMCEICGNKKRKIDKYNYYKRKNNSYVQ